MAPKHEKAVKPERVVLLMSGDSGTGKSFFVANLKNALIFDTDIGGGLSYLDARIARNDSERVEAGSYLDVIQELNRRRGRMANIATLAIDHLTTLQQEAVLRHNPNFEDDFGRSNDKGAREWRKIRELVRWGDFNLVCVSHLKDKYQNKKVVGLTADAAKKIEGDFTMYLHLEGRGPSVYPATANVVKWRRDPDDPRGRIPGSFPLTMEKFVELHGFPLEGPREEVPTASAEQVGRIKFLLERVKVPDDWAARALAKYKAEDWDELTAEVIGKAISHLEGLLRPAEAA